MVNRISNRWICNCGAIIVSIDWLKGTKVTCKTCGDSYIELGSDTTIGSAEKSVIEEIKHLEEYNTEYINDR